MRSLTRAVGAVVLTSLLATSAIAAPLPAGKPAGTQEAAVLGSGFVWIGILSIAALTALTLSSSGSKGVSTPTTSSTSTAGLP